MFLLYFVFILFTGNEPINIFLSDIVLLTEAPTQPFVPTISFGEVDRNENFTVISAPPPAPSDDGTTIGGDNLEDSASSLSISLFFVILLSAVLSLF